MKKQRKEEESEELIREKTERGHKTRIYYIPQTRIDKEQGTRTGYRTKETGLSARTSAEAIPTDSLVG